MALFKKFNVFKETNSIHTNETNTGLVINPASDKTIWINNEPHEYNSLFPIFNKDLKALRASKVVQNMGFIQNAVVAKGPMIRCGHESSWNSTYFGSKADSYLMKSRDLNLEDSGVTGKTSTLTSWEDGSGNKFNLLLFHTYVTYVGLSTTHYILIEGDDFSNPDAVISGTLSNGGAYTSNTQYHAGFGVLHVDATNKKIYLASRGTGSSSSSYRPQYYKNRVYTVSYTTVVDDGSLAFTSADATQLLETNYGNGTQFDIESAAFFYGGKNNDNTLMFFEYNQTDTNRATSSTAVRSSGIVTAKSYNTTSSSTTTVATLTTSNLSTASVSAKVLMRPRPSQFIQSSISGETAIYYSFYPVMDASDVVSFIRTAWDKSANSGAGSVTIANCTMAYTSGSASDYITNALLHVNDDSVGTRSNSWVTKTGSDYHLHYLASYGNSTNLARNASTAKNLVTYTINTTNWTGLTYHSSIQVDSLEFMHLNDNRNKIAVVSTGNCKVYSWNNGWTETANEGGTFVGVVQDEAGRILGLDGPSNMGNVTVDPLAANHYFVEHKVKLISDSLPTTVSIDFVNEDLTYSGSSITTDIKVNAYDSSSARIAKSVVLKIDGANAVFTTNSAKTLTATTSSSADTTVGLTITGPGPVTISGSFSI